MIVYLLLHSTRNIAFFPHHHHHQHHPASDRKRQSDHHFGERAHDEFVGVPAQVMTGFAAENPLQVGHLHDFAAEQSLSHLPQYFQDGLVENHVVVLHLVQVVHKLVDLLLADLQTVVELLVHDLAELELLGGTQVDEGIL